MSSPLSLYVKLSRLVFSVEPLEQWDDYDEFEDDILKLFNSIRCNCCAQLMITPVIPKKNHFSCQHRVCLDCIGRKRPAFVDCEMCNDYTLFEKSSSTKLVLDCFQELCELIHGSWIYEYIKKQSAASEAASKETSLIEVIESGMNYGKVSIVIDDTSSDENSCSSDSVIETTPIMSPIQLHTPKPHERPPSPVKTTTPTPMTCTNVAVATVQSAPPEPKPTTTILPAAPTIAIDPPVIAAAPMMTQPRPQLVQFPVQSPVHVSSTSRQLQPTLQQHHHQLLHHQQQQPPPPSYIYSPAQPMRLVSPSIVAAGKSIMTPMKLQTMPSTPQIYSVMYTGTGNKITFKRKQPDELPSPTSATSTSITTTTTIPIITQLPPMTSTSTSSAAAVPIVPNSIIASQQIHNQQTTANTTILQKTEPTNNPLVKQHQQQPMNVIPNNSSSSNNTTTTNQLNVNQSNSNEKRRGCRCGNATAAPGKLTCCGQRCPCYVDSKACIDCKCRGCRNPHFMDGHKKMRHPVPDPKTQQQQQQSFLASIQHQLATKEKVPNAVIPITTDLSLAGMDKSTFVNCLNGFQLKTTHMQQPRMMLKDPRTMNPVIFNPATQQTMHHHHHHQTTTSIATNSNIQIVGVYSQVQMPGDKKIIIKNEQTSSPVVTYNDSAKQPHFEASNAAAAAAFAATNNLNTNLL